MNGPNKWFQTQTLQVPSAHKPHLSNPLHWLLTAPGLYPSSLNNTLSVTIQKSITKGWREERPRESQQAGWFRGPKRQTSVYPPPCLSFANPSSDPPNPSSCWVGRGQSCLPTSEVRWERCVWGAGWGELGWGAYLRLTAENQELQAPVWGGKAVPGVNTPGTPVPHLCLAPPARWLVPGRYNFPGAGNAKRTPVAGSTLTE